MPIRVAVSYTHLDVYKRQPLVYGQSITDACIDWPETHTLLAELAASVRTRRR